MRNPHGHLAICGPGQTVEHDTFTCCHCNSIVIVKPIAPVEESGGWCLACSRPVCKACAGRPCVPFEKALERYEQRMAARRSYE